MSVRTNHLIALCLYVLTAIFILYTDQTICINPESDTDDTTLLQCCAAKFILKNRKMHNIPWIQLSQMFKILSVLQSTVTENSKQKGCRTILVLQIVKPFRLGWIRVLLMICFTDLQHSGNNSATSERISDMLCV